MTEESQAHRAAAESSAAADSADSPLSAEEAQSAATDALDEITMPSTAAAGEEVASAEEALPAEPATPDYQDLYLRASAEMDNLRKRARRDVGAAEARGIGKLARELLPAVDNLERALQAAETATQRSASPPAQGTGEGSGAQDFLKGIRLVQAEFVAALTRAGISIEDPKGEPFDPHRHEALAQSPVEGIAPGIVVEVYQPGYLLGDAVLRAARVVVSG